MGRNHFLPSGSVAGQPAKNEQEFLVRPGRGFRMMG
jgi:hypothetical protein